MKKEVNTIEELARLVDKTFHDYDPYNYRDCDMDYESVLEMLITDSNTVIQILCNMINGN